MPKVIYQAHAENIAIQHLFSIGETEFPVLLLRNCSLGQTI